jgi:hypothetical protein
VAAPLTAAAVGGLGGAILMLAPVIVVRLLRPRNRESLDGFVIGALGALTFTAAATFSRFAPQFAAGMVSRMILAMAVLQDPKSGNWIKVTQTADRTTSVTRRYSDGERTVIEQYRVYYGDGG